MVKRVNLNDSPEQRQAKRFQALEGQAPVGSTSITKPGAGLRIATDQGLKAQSVPGGGPAINVTGLQLVEGTLRVTGTLEGAGTWSWTGTLTTTGTTNLNGPTNVNGAWKLVGNGEIQGNVTQTGNLQVNAPGQIKVGANLTLAPATDGGAILLGGGKINANGTNLVLTADGGVSIFTAGGNVQVSSTGSLSISNLPTTADTRVPAGTIKTVGIAGTLYRTTGGPA